MLEKVQFLLMKVLLSCYVISITEAVVPDALMLAAAGSPTGAPVVAPAMPNLPLPANLPPFYRPFQKPISPVGAPVALSPTHPSSHDPLVTSGQPPTNYRLSKPFMKRTGSAPPLSSFKNIAPAQSHAGTLPSGLAQPPLSPTVSSKLDSESNIFSFVS